MKKCLDEIAGLDTTLVNKFSSLELPITLDSNYDHVNGTLFARYQTRFLVMAL